MILNDFLFERHFLSVKNKEDFVKVLGAFCESRGFLQYRLAIMLPRKNMAKPRAEIFSKCSKEWVYLYTSNNLVERDPVIYRCQHQSTPVIWSDLYSQSSLPVGFIDVMYEARKYGLYDGCSFPLRGPRGEFGILSLITANPDLNIKEAIKGVREVVDYILDAAIRVCSDTYPCKPLSRRELECLVLLAEGKTYIDIGFILGITPRTVKAHIESSVDKLGASSRTHAILLAAMSGLIHSDIADLSINNHLD